MRGTASARGQPAASLRACGAPRRRLQSRTGDSSLLHRTLRSAAQLPPRPCQRCCRPVPASAAADPGTGQPPTRGDGAVGLVDGVDLAVVPVVDGLQGHRVAQ